MGGTVQPQVGVNRPSSCRLSVFYGLIIIFIQVLRPYQSTVADQKTQKVAEGTYETPGGAVILLTLLQPHSPESETQAWARPPPIELPSLGHCCRPTQP